MVLDKRFVVLIACLMSVACNADGVDSEFGAIGFDRAETTELQSAANEWCEATDGRYCPTLLGGKNSIELVPELPGTTTGHYSQRDFVGRITILDRSSSPDWLPLLRRSALHELGHHSGCYGHLEPGNVMAEYEEDAPEHLTESDVACAIGGAGQ